MDTIAIMLHNHILILTLWTNYSDFEFRFAGQLNLAFEFRFERQLNVGITRNSSPEQYVGKK